MHSPYVEIWPCDLVTCLIVGVVVRAHIGLLCSGDGGTFRGA